MSDGPHVEIEDGVIWVAHGGLVGVDEPALFVSSEEELVPIPMSKVREAVGKSSAPSMVIQWWPEGQKPLGPKEWEALRAELVEARSQRDQARNLAEAWWEPGGATLPWKLSRGVTDNRTIIDDCEPSTGWASSGDGDTGDTE